MTVDLLATWVLGLGFLTMALYPIFGERGKNSTGGQGRHAAETGEGTAAKTTVRQRFGNVFGSFGAKDWVLFVNGAVFTLLALWRSCALLLG